jgi:tetratricopeptide (TPR) repeat protein
LLAEVSEWGNRQLLLQALHHMGWAESQRNEYAAALTHYGHALALRRPLSGQALEARVLRGMAVVHEDRGSHAEALRHGHEAVRLFETLGDRAGAGRSWHTIGVRPRRDGRVPRHARSLPASRGVAR